MIAGLITSYDVYEDLLAKSQKGIEFYRKLETNVTKLLQRIRGVARVQEEERQHITQRNQPKGKYTYLLPPLPSRSSCTALCAINVHLCISIHLLALFIFNPYAADG